MLCSTMAGACKCWTNIVEKCCVENLLSFGRLQLYSQLQNCIQNLTEKPMGLLCHVIEIITIEVGSAQFKNETTNISRTARFFYFIIEFKNDSNTQI